MRDEQRAFNGILTEFQIRTIVHIDDLFSTINDPAVELKSWALSFKEAVDLHIVDTGSWIVEDRVNKCLADTAMNQAWWRIDDLELFSDLITDWISHIKEPQKILNSLRDVWNSQSQGGSVTDEDEAHISTLYSLLPNSLDVHKYSLAQWRNSGIDDVRRKCADGVVLVFVDLDLSSEGGTREEGLLIIDEIVKRLPAEPVVAALLTHAVDSDGETDFWREKGKGRNADKWCVISKKGLELLSDSLPEASVRSQSKAKTSSDSDKLYTRSNYPFLRSLSMLFRNRAVGLLIQNSSNALQSAMDSTVRDIRGADYFELYQAVVSSPIHEGVDPIDTVFRLFSARLRRRARKLLRQDSAVRGALSQALTNFNDLGAPFPTAITKHPRDTWVWEQEEYFEADDLVIGERLPIANGDIFEIKGKKFVLVAQPCTLMVRRDGMRSRDDYFGAVATLIPIVSRERAGDLGRCYELKFFDQNESFFARLGAAQSAWLVALDMCVFGKDGAASLALCEPSEELAGGLLPNWVQREKLLRKFILGRLKHVAGLRPGDSKATTTSVESVPAVLLNGPPRVTMQYMSSILGSTVVYSNVRRIRRLAEHNAAALLSAYSFDAARPAFPHSLQGGKDRSGD